jgi:hypothetical protein
MKSSMFRRVPCAGVCMCGRGVPLVQNNPACFFFFLFFSFSFSHPPPPPPQNGFMRKVMGKGSLMLKGEPSAIGKWSQKMLKLTRE